MPTVTLEGLSSRVASPRAGFLTHQPHNDLYPVFLKVAGRKVVLVGGGKVAVSKHEPLRAAGAVLTVVAPEVDPALRVPGTIVHQRPFQPDDLDGAWFVVAAAPPEVNADVAAAAEARNLFVNAVDDTRSATAYLGGVVRRADVTLAISTGGGAPALAGLLREALEAVLPEDLDRWLATARDLRPVWKAVGVPMEQRRPLLLEALNQLYADRAAQVRP
jgi:uroporphyrin-III C-methyltransferase / precorrin-2 dehydrogenase / sirohydrochlorin ferrochelatase